MPKRRKAINHLMNEVILYGGLPVRRGDVYRDAYRRTLSRRIADLYAFGPETRPAPTDAVPLTRDELAQLP